MRHKFVDVPGGVRGNHDKLTCEQKKVCKVCGQVRWHMHHSQSVEELNQPEDCPEPEKVKTKKKTVKKHKKV